MAQEYPIMDGQAYLSYVHDDPDRAKAKAVETVEDMIEEQQLSRYLKGILVFEDSISVILSVGIIIRYGFSKNTGRVKGITEVEAYA